MPLQVGIVGAGIAGLSAAVALRRAGAEVEIFEMSAAKVKHGSAITITPNGARILRSWGFDTTAARATEILSVRLADAKTLEPVLTEDFDGFAADFGARMASYHPADLHNHLRYMAAGDNNHQPGIPAKLQQGRIVISIDCEKGEIALGNGTKMTKDLIVVSNGIRSRFIENIIDERPPPLMDVGWSTYRLSIPMYKFSQHSTLGPLFDHDKSGFWAAFDIRTDFYMMTCRCKSGKVLDIVLRHPAQPGGSQTSGQNTSAPKKGGAITSDWRFSAEKKRVLEIVSEYHPLLGDIMMSAEEVREDKLFVRRPLETFNKGRAVLIGDAAHTVMPSHAQDAVLAIEEAAALFQLFNGVRSREIVEPRLDVYTKVLKKHIHMVQYLSNDLPGLGDQNRLKAEELWGEGLYSRKEHSFSKSVREFFYSYDIEIEFIKFKAREEMKRAKKTAIPEDQ